MMTVVSQQRGRCGSSRKRKVRDREDEVDGGKYSRDKVWHIKKNDQMYVTKMMLVAERE